MTSADRRARTSRGGRPAPRAKCPSGRWSGRSADGRTSSGSILPNDSSTFRLPPDSRSSSEASVPVSQFHGRSGLSHPIHSPPPPSRHSTTVSSSFDICLPTFRRCFSYPSKAWRGKRPDSQGHDWLRGGVPYPDGAFHVLTDQGVLHDEGEAQGLDTQVRAWRLAGRNRSGRIQNGALRRLGDGAVAGPSIYPAMSCAETLKSEEPGELKGAERK